MIKLTKDKKFKALMIDVDGTLIPYAKDALPSTNVTKLISQAAGIIHIGLATQRPLFAVENIAQHLKLSGPSIIAGGAQIYDFTNDQVLWEKSIEKKDIPEILKISTKFKVNFVVFDKDQDFKLDSSYQPHKPLDIYSSTISEQLARKLRKELLQITEIAVNIVPSWEGEGFVVLINHALATKQHGIFEIAKLLKIKTGDIIGIGDGYNDFPLLMACGFKVAMGNAFEDLKEIADYVAPSVYEDGVADVIKKFVLT